ncbi:hypothetical protein W824_13820 [Clavibacter cf. michiganensis LMG 26808]|nr:hypothetical protein W824_13820 [Clavibacter cf. michiganensis LMG 26808]
MLARADPRRKATRTCSPIRPPGEDGARLDRPAIHP